MKDIISRRSFIKKSAAWTATGAIAAPMLLDSCSRNDRVNLAFLGMGGRASGLLQQFILIPGTQVVAICDPMTDRREDRTNWVNEVYAKREDKVKYQICEAYNHFEEVLKRKDIDAVVIGTPDHWHIPLAYQAIKAGKDVYVEKPLGLSISDGIKLRDLATKNKAIVQYGTQQRSEDQFHLAAEIAATGQIGKLTKIDAWCSGGADSFGRKITSDVPAGLDYDLWLGPAPLKPYMEDRCFNHGDWFIYDYAIGFIAGWGAHPLDIAQWGNQSDNTSPVLYEGEGGYFEPDNLFDTINRWDIHCRYANGVEMHFFSSDKLEDYVSGKRDNITDHGTTFWGSDGWVSVDRSGIEVSDPGLLEIGNKEAFQIYRSENHYKNFIDCVKSRKPTVSPLEAGVRSDAISHLCNVLIRSGAEKLEWDPIQEQIINPSGEMEALMNREAKGWLRSIEMITQDIIGPGACDAIFD